MVVGSPEPRVRGSGVPEPEEVARGPGGFGRVGYRRGERNQSMEMGTPICRIHSTTTERSPLGAPILATGWEIGLR
jgi:hypothetical protein